MAIDGELNALDISHASPQSISPFLHALHARGNPVVRCYVLNIVCALELVAPQSIIEECKFDILITRSLEAPPPEVAAKQDEERCGTFKAIVLMLRLRHYLPESVIRSLVAVCGQPKPFKSCAMCSLCQAAIHCPELIKRIPEAWQLLVDNLVETGNSGILQLILYSVEHSAPFVYQAGFISHLLSPLGVLSQAKADPAKQQNAVRILMDLLLTWPGLIWFGFRAGLFRDLLRLMPRHPDAILGIFSKVLNFDAPKNLIDGYVGFALSGLLPLGLIATLSAVGVSHSPTATFLAGLLPYVPEQSAPRAIAPRPTVRQGGVVGDVPALISKLAHGVGAEGSTSSIAQFTFPPDPDSWPWMVIRRLLTIVLPNDSAELNPATCKHFVQRLLDYFADSHAKFDALREECLQALLTLLVENEAVTALLESHAGIRRVLESAIQEIAKKPAPQFIRCVGILVCSVRGSGVLTKWRIIDSLTRLGESCNTASMAADAFMLFRSPHLPQNAVTCILGFLRGSSLDAFPEVLRQIVQLLPIVDNFASEVFAPIILKYVQTDFPGVGNPRNAPFIAFLSEVLVLHPPSLAVAAADPEIHGLLRENTRAIYALVFSQPAAFTTGFLADEITWWLETGNTEYVATFQAAAQAVHAGTAARLPAHLFGELARTPTGRVAAEPHIPQLVKKLRRTSKQCGALFALAHFASDRATHDIMEKSRAFPAMIEIWKNPSYETKGVVLASFALIATSRVFKNALSQDNWQLFSFGERTSAFPCDLGDLPTETVYTPPAPIDEGPPDQGRAWVKQLSSSITLNKAKAGIEGLDGAKKAELAPFAFGYLARFFVTADGRDCLMRALGGVSAVPVPQRTATNLKASAIMAAKVFVASRGDSRDSLTKITIPTGPIGQIDETKACPRAPEVFVTDAEFAKWAKMSKDAFWALGEPKVSAGRRALLQHKRFS
jgi:hypothetical protein